MLPLFQNHYTQYPMVLSLLSLKAFYKFSNINTPHLPKKSHASITDFRDQQYGHFNEVSGLFEFCLFVFPLTPELTEYCHSFTDIPERNENFKLN